MAPALFRTALLFALSVLGASCKGSLGAEAKMKAELDAPDSGGALDAEAASEVAGLTDDGGSRSLAKPDPDSEKAPAPTNEAPPLLPLYGARHDVTVRSTTGAVACRCVDVLIGPPTMTQVQWQGEVPRTKPEEQLLVAFAPAEECPGMPEGSQGGSYWGYRVSGKDVLVLLEAWQPEGKKTPPPRTIAAIIPRPAVGGQVYVAPVDAKLPFGTSVDGSATRCALGNPGPARTTPLIQTPPPADEGGWAN